MKGLLIKDFLLMLQQRTFFILFLFMAVMLNFSTDGSFVIGYLTFVSGVFVLSTISYDEYDNGYSFLMTLPVRRKDYVLEKYVFGLIVSSVSWLVGVLIAIIFEVGRGKNFVLQEMLWGAGVCFLLALLLLAVMIPVQIRFGGEKGRLVMFGIFGGVVLVGYFVFQILERQKVDLDRICQMLTKLPVAGLVGMLLLTTIVFEGISYVFGCKIMEKKEF